MYIKKKHESVASHTFQLKFCPWSSLRPLSPRGLPLLSYVFYISHHFIALTKNNNIFAAYTEGSKLTIQVKAFEIFFNDTIHAYDLPNIKSSLWFSLNLQCVQENKRFMMQWPTFNEDLADNPEETLNCVGLAMHQYIFKIADKTTTEQNILRKIHGRIEGYGPLMNVRSLKVSSYARLISVRGTIIRANAAQLLCSWMTFRCGKCGADQAIQQPEGIMTAPTSCKRNGCQSRSGFIPQICSPFTRTEPFQTIRLQESMQGVQFDSGRVPRSVEVELSHDLVNSVCPGDDVTVTGILKVHPYDENQKKGHASMFTMYLVAVTVVSNKNVLSTRKSEFTECDLETIEKIKSDPCPFRLLVHSLCPSIYGNEMIKAGLLLGLFGGSANSTGRRSESHVLIVGDPGVGKSQMLQACAQVSPRGVFVCGNSSSCAGLTVSVRHEKGSSGSLEAGALVLADQGACCIDEFDKMSSNHQVCISFLVCMLVFMY